MRIDRVKGPFFYQLFQSRFEYTLILLAFAFSSPFLREGFLSMHGIPLVQLCEYVDGFYSSNANTTLHILISIYDPLSLKYFRLQWIAYLPDFLGFTGM